LELIELKFCKLDKNIKKNISIRAFEDIQSIDEIEASTQRNSLLDDDNENNNEDNNYENNNENSNNTQNNTSNYNRGKVIN